MADSTTGARDAQSAPPFRLTALAHGGGCGCKIGPALLREMLSDACFGFQHPDLLVGAGTSDDAAVYRINDRQAVIATTDFFMPIVDDPFEFGRIAATNALSDVYAMGGSPILALAIVGMPVGKMPSEVMRRIMEGGADVCHAAGIPLAGGHSIDSPEPIYGLAALGLVEPDRIKRNDGARAGDVLVLGKPLGIGVLSAALKKGILDERGYAQMVGVTTQLNRVGRTLAGLPGVHAMTDVTGFGLAGHLLEICRGSDAGAVVDFARVPLHPGVADLVRAGHATGASGRNWAGYGADVRIDAPDPDLVRTLVTDPQTSGGLLVACAPADVDGVLAAFARDGFDRAAVIGEIVAGAPHVVVR